MENNNNLPIGTPQEAEQTVTSPIAADVQQEAAPSVQTEIQPDTTTVADMPVQTAETQPQSTPETPVQNTVNYGYVPTAAQSATQQPYNPYQQTTAASYSQTSYQPAGYNTYASTNPYQAQMYAQAVNPNKKSAGKIVSLVIGIILAVIGAFLTFCVTVSYVDELNTYGEAYISIPVYVVVLAPLILGIVLIVLGCKKKKNVAQTAAVTSSTSNYYAAAQSTSYAQNTTPVQTATAYQPTAATTATAATPVTTTATTATPVTTTATTATPVTTTTTAATPVIGTSAQTNAAPAAGTSPMSYQYTPTVTIQDDSKALGKSSAMKSGLLAIGAIVLMWILLFATGYIFWYLLIIPFVLAAGALKSNIKSVVGWLSMILSVLSALLFIFLLIA